MAVPRDIEPEVADLENVYLYDVDSLTHMVDDHLAGRRKEAEAAELIVEEEVARFRASMQVRGVVPTIKALREQAHTIARAEADKAIAKMHAGMREVSEKDRKEIQSLAEAIVNKLLHKPVTALKREAEPEALAAAVRLLFELHEDAGHNETAAGQTARVGGGEAPALRVVQGARSGAGDES